MSYHPYGHAKNGHGSSRAHRTSKSSNHTALNPVQSSSASASTIVRAQPSASSNNRGLTSNKEIMREGDEAELAWREGRITLSDYAAVLRSCLHKTAARGEKMKMVFERLRRGEDLRLQEALEYTDSEMDAHHREVDRNLRVEMENERRSKARMLRRTITRGL